jgi:leucyl/phenylalanyl-tRNA---protein transferase
VKPPNLYRLAGTFGILTKHYAGLASRNALPDPEKALRWPDGLAGVCAELSAPTLRAAYARGLYPSSQIGPQTWWAPATRMVLFIENFHIEQNVRQRLRYRDFHITFDYDFGAVIRACAGARAQRMGPGLIEAFMAAFQAGLAHSAEVWDRSGALAGGFSDLP